MIEINEPKTERRTVERFFRHDEIGDWLAEFSHTYDSNFTRSEFNTLTTFLHARLNATIRNALNVFSSPGDNREYLS